MILFYNLPPLGKRRFLNDQNPLRRPYVIADKPVTFFQDQTLVQLGIADHPRHGTDIAPLCRQRNRRSLWPFFLDT